MNLLRAETERLAARRFVQLMLALLLAALAVTVATTLAGSHRPTGTELSRAQTLAAEERRNLEQRYQDCLTNRRAGSPVGQPDPYPEGCTDLDPAQRERLPVATDYLFGVFVFAHQAKDLMYFLVTFLVLFGFLVGASYLGVDLNSGGMTNLLLWRPQRTLVLGTKLAALLAVTAAVSLVASAGYLGAFWLIGQSAGLPGKPDGAFWADLSQSYARGLGLVLLATALGFALAGLGRHTAAALGTVAAYAVVWEFGARLVMEIVAVHRPEQLMLSSHVIAWVAGGTRFWDDNLACVGGGGSYCDRSYLLSWEVALLVLLGLVGGLTATFFAVFRRRDLV